MDLVTVERYSYYCESLCAVWWWGGYLGYVLPQVVICTVYGQHGHVRQVLIEHWVVAALRSTGSFQFYGFYFGLSFTVSIMYLFG